MYVRMVRYQGGELGDVKAGVDLIRQDIAAARRGEACHNLPSDMARVASRLQLMVNRVDASVAVLVYCDTIQQVGEADRIIAAMRARRNGWGERDTLDIYDVLIDDSPRELELLQASGASPLAPGAQPGDEHERDAQAEAA